MCCNILAHLIMEIHMLCSEISFFEYCEMAEILSRGRWVMINTQKVRSPFGTSCSRDIDVAVTIESLIIVPLGSMQQIGR